ncbi:DNA polymerase III subunit beta [bacterium HR39]|nr:DNA polymerase III subunit beta [bacterium HR39]
MKVVVAPKAFAQAVAAAADAADRKASVPALRHVFVEAGGGSLAVLGTDLDRAVRAEAPADVEEDGAATAPVEVLARLVRNIGAVGDLVIEGDGRGGLLLRAAAGDFEARLPGIPPEEFPDIRPRETAVAIRVPGRDLAVALETVEHAVSHEETRYYLNGVCVWPAGEGAVVLVATDAHRLAEVALTSAEVRGTVPEGGLIIPRAAVPIVLRIASAAARDDAAVELRFGGGLVAVRHGGLSLVSRLVDGQFPAYERVMPKGERPGLRVGREALEDAAELVGGWMQAVRSWLVLEAGEGRLTVRGTDDATAVSRTLPAEGDWRGKVGFNARYVADAMDALEGESVVLRVGGPSEPVGIEAPDHPLPVRFVLMPVRIAT